MNFHIHHFCVTVPPCVDVIDQCAVLDGLPGGVYKSRTLITTTHVMNYQIHRFCVTVPPCVDVIDQCAVLDGLPGGVCSDPLGMTACHKYCNTCRE